MADVQERDVAEHALQTKFSPTISASAFEKSKPGLQFLLWIKRLPTKFGPVGALRAGSR
ncbi:hypothetical protein SAMN02927900_05246 [Rhizobium mongolense subsp. loessense]|uniref:Uncharacterized protein n=1 Tax=Rhizobium mongolense subsp. loessense TaxID=158890 RepID=A0A1G4TJN4_9HYPH|nr:hypothetical protein [Rhizobium mongolense]SCW81512.1 hypothetical protein SAMN02927900_05246 [Rhizobium mongolense subsp. loessense]